MTQLGLRERKSAKLKIGLAETMVELLEQKPLEEIAVRELCEAHEISEATFFNYFPRKQDVLVYFIQLWSIEMGWMARTQLPRESGLEAIEMLFQYGAGQFTQYPAFMAEMIAHQARLREWPGTAEIGLAERLQAFPDMDGVETIPVEGLDAILSQLLKLAVEKGELPEDVEMESAVLGLVAIFFGIPMSMRLYDAERIGEMYQSELRIFWKGLQT